MGKEILSGLHTHNGYVLVHHHTHIFTTMKKTIFVLGLLTAAVLGNVLVTTSGCSPKGATATGGDSTITNKFAILPADITELSQTAADVFSWQTFIAMNWPASTANCGPDTTNGVTILSDKGPTVWETYLSTDQVFVADTLQPAPWCSNTGNNGQATLHLLPPTVQALAQKTGVYRFVHRISKFPNGLEQAVGGPLVDQNGRFVRYEVRMNSDEYNYIVKNNLWDTAGQRQFAKNNKQVTLPFGKTTYGSVGAMEFKAAWKILGKNDDPSHFYKIRAIVYNDDNGDPSPGENPVTLGLVGLHIAHKTPNQRNWVWSTFEQEDNLTKSFFNPNCDTCTPNKPLPQSKNYVELSPDGKPLNPPTQVTRVNKVVDPVADSVNRYFQALLKGSVWSHYQLVSTQWLFAEDMTPSFLANSVQETFAQGPHPASYGNFHTIIDQPYYADTAYHPFSNMVSSSCMGCHYVATLPYLPVKSDFSFILGEAH